MSGARQGGFLGPFQAVGNCAGVAVAIRQSAKHWPGRGRFQFLKKPPFLAQIHRFSVSAPSAKKARFVRIVTTNNYKKRQIQLIGLLISS
jgi:hypothetical protein